MWMLYPLMAETLGPLVGTLLWVLVEARTRPPEAVAKTAAHLHKPLLAWCFFMLCMLLERWMVRTEY
jgi:ABC-type branched-subunit amino acid transport system permease subunit